MKETTLTDANTALSKALRKAAFTTSWLWDHIHIEVGAIDKPFHIIGNAEVNGGPAGPDRAGYLLLVRAKSAARKAMDWFVNGESGLRSIPQFSGIFLSDHEFTNDDIEDFATLWAYKATAFMMTSKQLRALMAATPSLIKKLPGEGDPSRRLTLLGRHIIVNDYIDYADHDIWGLNLSPDGLHLCETAEGIRREPDGNRVLWDVGLGYKSSSDVTVMRQS